MSKNKVFFVMGKYVFGFVSKIIDGNENLFIK